MKNYSIRVLVTGLLLALLIAAALPVAAMADEGEPPAPTEEPEATEPAPTEEPAPTAETATTTDGGGELEATPDAGGEEALPAEAAPAESTSSEEVAVPVETDAVATEEVVEPADLLAELPEGTELVVLDEQGEAIPLASEAAADLLQTGDPMWCPLGVTPGGVGCSINYGSMALLIADVGTGLNPAANGVIWITGFSVGGVDASGPNTFDGSLSAAWITWSAFDLTFKGGWTGVGTTINTADPSQFNKGLTITFWSGNITLSDITISGATGTGLAVSTTKNILLTRFSSSSNAGGAYLNNTGGIGSVTITNGTFNSNTGPTLGLDIFSNGTITLNSVTVSSNSARGAVINNGSGNVVISNSAFDLNNGFNGSGGLKVDSLGTITLTNVTANDNYGASGWGARLDNSSAGSAKNITLTNVEFSNNLYYGATVRSTGLVTIKDATASDNGGSLVSGNDGMIIDNTFGTAVVGVTFTGTNIFLDNEDNGVSISSDGAVKLNNVIANSNGGLGAAINNTTASTAQPVTLTGSSQFVYNGMTGLEISSDGLVTLNNITANSNQTGSGVFINNTTGATAGVTITGTNYFSDNDFYGLEVYSNGNISVNSLTANGNNNVGVYLNNSYDLTSPYATVKMTGTNTLIGNASHGLFILTNGAITLNSVTSNGSITGEGAYLSNTTSGFTASKQPVTLTGTNKFINNDSNGLYISSYGPVTLNNITANENGSIGSGNGLFLENKDADTPMAVTVNGTNTFNDNYYDGIWVRSKGAIKFSSTTASGNGIGGGSGNGATLDNNFTGAAGGITLTGTNVFSENKSTGLNVSTTGAVSLSAVTASSNQVGNGVYVNNTYGNCVLVLVCTVLSPAGVTISGTNTFSSNWLEGLKVESYGSISLNSATAHDNGLSGGGDGDGVYLFNSTGTIAKGITLTGTSSFENNFDSGVNADSLGAIKLNNITASSNGENGATLFNNYSVTSGITLSGANIFNYNDDLGLSISTHGAVTLNSVNASYNGADGTGSGADIYSADIVTPSLQKVTLTGTNVFNGNNGYGLGITSQGAISLQNVYAVGNLIGVGVGINNCYNLGSGCSGTGSVTIGGSNNFSGNYESGIQVQSNGAITLNNVTANANGLVSGYGVGASLDNCLFDVSSCITTSVQKIALTGTNTFSDNRTYGLAIRTKGAITSATKLTVNNNQSHGALLDNNEPSAVGGITLSGSNTFNGNTYSGLDVSSLGAIAVSNLTADDNGWFGAYLINNAAGSAMNVTLSGKVHTSGNLNGDGVHVVSIGSISLSSVTADQNVFDGLDLDNSGATADGKGVTISGTNLITNSTFGNGVLITSKGPITINNLTSNDNGLAGLFADNSYATVTPQTAKLTGTNVFNDNDDFGAAIVSDGAITVNNVTANGNVDAGLYLNNDSGTAGVTVTGVNTFNANDVHGLWILTNGNISLSKITADGNGGKGLYIWPTAGNVTITCGSFTNNTGIGLDIDTTPGTITLKGVVYSGNLAGNFNWHGDTPVVSRTC
jgi:hypothetical protein